MCEAHQKVINAFSQTDIGFFKTTQMLICTFLELMHYGFGIIQQQYDATLIVLSPLYMYNTS